MYGNVLITTRGIEDGASRHQQNSVWGHDLTLKKVKATLVYAKLTTVNKYLSTRFQIHKYGRLLEQQRHYPYIPSLKENTN